MSLLSKMMRMAGRSPDGKARALQTDVDGNLATNLNVKQLVDETITQTVAAGAYIDYVIDPGYASLGISVRGSEGKLSVGVVGYDLSNEFVIGNIPYEEKTLQSIGGAFGAYWEKPTLSATHPTRVYIRNTGTVDQEIAVSIVGKHSQGEYPSEETKNSFIHGSKIEVIEDNKEKSLLAPSITYEPRDTDLKRITFPHLEQGIFEQSITVYNTLDADISIEVIPLIKHESNYIFGSIIYSGTIIADGGRTILTTEVSDTIDNTPQRKIIGLLELRQPYTAFRMNITALSTPTEGEVFYKSMRRY